MKLRNWIIKLVIFVGLVACGLDDEKLNIKVMVSYRLGSKLDLLSEEFSANVKTPATLTKPGEYLVDVVDFAQLDELAVLSHQDNHYCGSLQLTEDLSTSVQSEIIAPIVSPLHQLDSVSNSLDSVSASNILSSIQTLEGYGTRFHSSEKGLEASENIRAMLISALGSAANISSALVSNSISNQKSVKIKITGTKYPDEYVILGAHLDSINYKDNTTAPGADDDASGIATLNEIARVIGEKSMEFERSVELHAYAAEEIGLVGSKNLADSYAAASLNIVSMLQFDMNAYHAQSGTKTIYFVNNDTSSTMTRAMKNLTQIYQDGDYIEAKLDAGTSDHKSWFNKGFQVAFPFENPAQFNSSLHTAADVSTKLNTEISARHAKLGLSYLMHFAGETDSVNEQSNLAQPGAELSNDLKIAITKGSTAGKFFVAFAAAADTNRVEICEIEKSDSYYCFYNLVFTDETSSGANRYVAAHSQELSLNSGKKYLIQGFNGKDQLISQRRIELGAAR